VPTRIVLVMQKTLRGQWLYKDAFWVKAVAISGDRFEKRWFCSGLTIPGRIILLHFRSFRGLFQK
jgi:hypothetical protein